MGSADYLDIQKLCNDWRNELHPEITGLADISRLHFKQQEPMWRTVDGGLGPITTSKQISVNCPNETCLDLCVKSSLIREKKVSLLPTVVKGIQETLEIQYDAYCVPQEAKDIFGKSFIINLLDGLPVDVYRSQSQQSHSAKPIQYTRNALAKIAVSNYFYIGKFDCRLNLTGKVYFKTRYGSVSEQTIGEIVREMNVSSTTSGDYNFFSLTDANNGISWTMAGVCELTWDQKPNVAFIQ
ncbi:hypothetical protein BgiBS90_018339 [Biomphalaria glabrata]|nr:hypothetical protein BgiBS90_018339 [Biomphalaria glabrata]